MGLKDKKLLSLKEIDGPLTPHDAFVKREVEVRKEALAHVSDVPAMARYLGGEAETLGISEDWAVRKDFFPGVEIHFIYTRADEEFPSSLRILYSGENIRKVKGEDLVELTVAGLNHMLRYVRETVENPPEICNRV